MAQELTLEQARAVITAGEKKAGEIGQPMNIAVVDEGGNLLAFARMADAWLGSIDIALSKAFTARAFNLPTKDLGALSQPGKPLFGIHATNAGRVVIFAGGLPLERGGRIIGAVGVSGGSVEQDQVVAEAAAAALGA